MDDKNGFFKRTLKNRNEVNIITEQVKFFMKDICPVCNVVLKLDEV